MLENYVEKPDEIMDTIEPDNNPPIYESITEREVPDLSEEQLALFNMETIRSQEVMKFNPTESLTKIRELEGKRVIGADFGGDKGVTKLFVISDGKLVESDGYSDYVQGDFGDGYIESLEKTAAYAAENGIPVGISWGSPLEGTKLQDKSKFKIFSEQLNQKYGGDFANLIPNLTSCINDGPAGLISAAIEAKRSHNASDVIFLINGGGIGCAVLRYGIIYSTEAGHVEAEHELNSYNQQEPCGAYGAEYICMERLGANKAGIEAQWQQLMGEDIDAREIENKAKAGDKLASDLYDNSALVIAHVIQGVANVYDINLTDENSAVAGHGGAFKFPHYGERVKQILDKSSGGNVKLFMTKDYVSQGSNACLDGAAISAIIAN